MTAALHALILFDFYLLISGLGYPGVVVFHQQNMFSIKKEQQEPYTSSKQQERHNKELKELIYNFLVAETDSLGVPAPTPCRTTSTPRTVLSKKGEKNMDTKEDSNASA